MTRRLRAGVLLSISLALVLRLQHQARPARPAAGTALGERDGLLFGAYRRAGGGGDVHRALRSAAAPADDDDAEEDRDNAFSLENIWDEDYDASFAAAYDDAAEPPRPPAPPPRPYALEDAVGEAQAFEGGFALFVYDPESGNFVGLRPEGRAPGGSDEKLLATMESLAFLLHRLLPERLAPSSPELVLAVAAGEYPQVRPSELPRVDGAAPVLMFGSVFRDGGLYPNMVPMPMPDTLRLLCLQRWGAEGADHWHRELKGLEFEKHGLGWDDLIPQVIWRGSDLSYLPSLAGPPQIQPYAYKPRSGEQNSKESAVRALRNNYDRLTPRWKGVVLSAEAELEAERISEEQPPWANIKFPGELRQERIRHYLQGRKVRRLRGTGANSREEDLVEYRGAGGIATGEHLLSDELARYRYHVDLGGGGGTAWAGTLQRLALPGLLFRQAEPTEDYLRGRLVPWRHYVPVAEDLADLRAKFDWAERHPREAAWIAGQGAAFARRRASGVGVAEAFREDLAAPLRRAVEAYRPVGADRPGETWRDVLGAIPGGDKMRPFAECSGIDGSCRPLDMDREAGKLSDSGKNGGIIGIRRRA